MKHFEWNDKYSVKVKSLDEQHKQFFEITNQILTVADNKVTADLKNEVIRLVVELVKYSMYHLDFEEECMKRYKFEGTEHHCIFHNIFRSKSEEFLKTVKSAGLDQNIVLMAKEIATFSQNWLAQHILELDRGYIPCFEKQKIR